MSPVTIAAGGGFISAAGGGFTNAAGGGLIIVPATADHACAMAPLLRPADAAEIAAMGRSPEQSLIMNVDLSLWARTALDQHGAPVAMWGVGALSWVGGIGGPWAFSTPWVDANRRAFLTRSRREVARMQADFPILVGWVDGRYGAACRWLKHLGFTVGDTTMDVGGVPFLSYRKDR